MSTEIILSRLRKFYLGFSAFIFAGSLFELTVLNHTGQPVQLLPFILGAVGLLLVAWAFFRPSMAGLRLLRVSMALIILGSLVGVYFHLRGNLEAVLDSGASLTLFQQVVRTLGGENPLMAPGILAIAAVLAIAATYGQKALASEGNRVAVSAAAD